MPLSRKSIKVLLLALIFHLMSPGVPGVFAQTTNKNPAKKVLLVFSESRDLPGNVKLEQAVRSEMLAHNTNQIDFFTESLDANRFPNTQHFRQFEEYLKTKYTGQHLDLVMAFMARDFSLADKWTLAVVSNLPVVFVAVNELEVPAILNQHLVTGIVQRYDIQGTLKLIFQLQPETRRVIVVGGVSETDQITLDRIRQAAQSLDDIQFEFWTNRPMSEMETAAAVLPANTAILLASVQRDVTGQPYYTAQVAQTLAPAASVPVYVLGDGLIGSGALGGSVVNSEKLGIQAGQLATQILTGTSVSRIPIEVQTNGTLMMDWRALNRWQIKQSRLPADCEIRYRPHSLWEDHKILILLVGAGLVAQAITIVALLVQRQHRRQAELQIIQQRTELAHVTRVSTMGQLATALTHELNQPLGAILRNAEAAEIFLQADQPNLEEVRAILADIRKDDKRAGNVIDRMRTLFKRRSLVSSRLDLRELVEDTVGLAQPDAAARQIKLTVQISPQLPAARGDRVHLQQVLLNLILNGMDAMSANPKSRRLLVVRVKETQDGNLQVEVSDLGTGISPDDAVHIFEPFFTTKPNGMGMGLAISRTIIEAHGGNIWMKSNTLKGTTFTFTLPQMKAEPAKDGGLPATT